MQTCAGVYFKLMHCLYIHVFFRLGVVQDMHFPHFGVLQPTQRSHRFRLLLLVEEMTRKIHTFNKC